MLVSLKRNREIDISALACATPADFIACGNTGSVSSTGIEKLKNLAVGDEFSTYDYIVRVIEVSGSETSGWTGKGELVMNFLKIGSSPVVEIPLAVKFENMHLNQCYQILPGSKVITAFDPNWSNVVSIDNIQSELEDIKKEIIELIEAGTPSSNTQIQSLITRLGEIRDEDISSWDTDVKTGVTTNINNFISGATCAASSNPNARTLSCNPEESLTMIKGIDLNGYEVVTTAQTIRDSRPKNGNPQSSGGDYSLVFGDRPLVKDPRFDILGKSRYNYCLKIGEYTNFRLYKEFISNDGLGKMADHLKEGSGLTLDFSNDSQITAEIKQSTPFSNFINSFQNEVKNKILTSTVNQINNSLFSSVRNSTVSPNFSILNGANFARVFIAMGGTQYYNISLKVYRKKTVPATTTTLSNFVFDYEVEFRDTYGADFDDINSGVKGFSQALNSFFTLQHYYGYKPYYTKVKVRKSFTYK